MLRLLVTSFTLVYAASGFSLGTGASDFFSSTLSTLSTDRVGDLDAVSGLTDKGFSEVNTDGAF